MLIIQLKRIMTSKNKSHKGYKARMESPPSLQNLEMSKNAAVHMLLQAVIFLSSIGIIVTLVVFYGTKVAALSVLKFAIRVMTWVIHVKALFFVIVEQK